MAAQKMLAHLKPYVIPTPREITASCGMALRFASEEDANAAGAVIRGHPDIEALSSWHALD